MNSLLRFTLLGLLIALMILPGCVGVPDKDLPSEPIAVLHWSRDAHRRRQEILKGNPAPGAPRREGVANVEDVQKWLGAVSGAAARRELARYPGHLSLYDPQTGKLTRLQAAAPGSRPLAWSKDHRRLMFAVVASDRSYQIREYNLDTEEIRRITYGSESHVAADYGPDGRIAYGGIRFPRSESERASGRIYVADEGGGLPEVLAEGALAEAIRWSPLGDAIVFVIRHRVRSMTIESRPLLLRLPLTPGAQASAIGAGQHPTFTPDGEWIIYSAPHGDKWRLRRVRPDGSGRAALGGSVRNEGFPAVSPDGRFVAYLARVSELDRLFLRRMDGSGDRVLSGDGSFSFPVW